MLAVCLPELAATATVTRRTSRSTPYAGVRGTFGAEALVRAAITRFAALAGEEPDVDVEVTTTVPREVGLAGSSAIVISVLKALAALTGTALEPQVLAREALAAEVEELGIAAGPQDRIVQSMGGLVAMDFPAQRYEALDPTLLPELFIAHRTDRGTPSGGVHGGLRARWQAGDPVVVAGMRELAELAASARDALLRGDREQFARCVDGSFDVRATMIELDPADARLIAIAREHGAAANYAGSGGAVVGIFTPSCDADALAAAYADAGGAFRRADVHSSGRDGRRLDDG